jgi:D-alanine transfer protein
MKKIISLLIPIIIAVLVTVAVNSFLDKKIEVLTKQKDISVMGKKFSDFVKDKSSLDKKLLSDKGDLFLLASSEMSIKVPQNPLKLFPIKGETYDLSGFGRAFSQSLQQANYLGGADINDNQKVAYVLSIQWFEKQNELDPASFVANFSEVQFYKFLNNPKISENNKRYYADRVYNFLTKAKKYSPEAYYAKLYLDSSKFSTFQKAAFKPYYEIKQYLLDVQDKALIYEELKDLPNIADKKQPKEINWDEEYKKIENENEKLISTNELKLEDNYYKEYLGSTVSKHKGECKSDDLLSAKEMDDYKFFLSVCKDLNIKPYIILQPANGWYADYEELSKDARQNYYEEIKKLSKDSGFEVLDLSQYEYKQYFLFDTQHFGKEGWLKVDEEIYKHFK